MQKDIGQKLMVLPFSPINGTILIRSGQASVDHFTAEMADQFPYPRAIFVPLDMPAEYERAVKSPARRALGPAGDLLEESGEAFHMRTIGVRTQAPDEGDLAAVDEPDSEGDEEMADVETLAEDR